MLYEEALCYELTKSITKIFVVKARDIFVI